MITLTFFLVFFANLLPRIDGFSCPKGSEQIPRERVCVYSIDDANFYRDGLRKCFKLGGDMVQIRSGFENAFLFALITSEFNHETPYIGIEKNASGTWTYSDGSPLTYQNWAPGEPVNREASICAMMDQQSGQWRAAECTIPRPYYCEIDGTKFQCPDGWTYYSDLNNMDYCYYVQTFNYKDASNWLLYSRDAAEDLCQKMKAHLVSIHSKNESVFVFNLVRSDLSTFTKPTQSLCANQWAWIGLYGNGVNVNMWSDGSPYDYDIVEEKIPSPYNWGISNDPSCNLNKYWHNDGGYPWARFVCKRPAPQMMKKKMINKH